MPFTVNDFSDLQFYQNKANAIFGRYLRHGENMTAWVADKLHEALEIDQISTDEYDQVMAADLLWGGKTRQTGEEIILVIEASWLTEANDVERAIQRAAVLHRIGVKALPVIAGNEWTDEAANLAQAKKVVMTDNGKVDATSWQGALSAVEGI